MLDRLKKLYDIGKLKQERLHWYVDREVITEDEYDEIVYGTEEKENGQSNDSGTSTVSLGA